MSDIRKRRLVDPKNRVRVSKACNRCKRQKVKCDGLEPCATCKKHGHKCQYTQSTSAIRNFVGSVTAPVVGSVGNTLALGPPVHLLEYEFPGGGPLEMSSLQTGEYIASLQNKIRSLESKLSYLGHNNYLGDELPVPRDRAQSANGSHIDKYYGSHVGPRLGGLSRKSEIYLYSSIKWRILRNDQNILVDGFAKLLYDSLNSDQKSLVSVPRTQHFGWNLSGSHYIKSDFSFNRDHSYIRDHKNWKNLLDGDIELSNYLINYFLIEINPLFAILNEPVFMSQYKLYWKSLKQSSQGIINKNSGLSDKANNIELSSTSANNDNLYVAKLYLVYAISMRFTEFGLHKKYKFGLEEQVFEIAYEIVSKLSFHWESFELIQGWLLIFLYLRVTYKQSSAHFALSNAVKMARGMAMDYNVISPRKCHEHVAMGKNDDLKAKRLFWAVYTMDKLFGLQSGKNLQIFDEYLNLIYPSWDFYDEDDGWLKLPGLAMIKLATISGNLQFFSVFDNERLLGFDFEKIQKELLFFEEWAQENGLWSLTDTEFHDAGYYYTHGPSANQSDHFKNHSSLLISQIKFHYYHVCFNLHMKSLYPLINQPNIFAQIGINRYVNFQDFSPLFSQSTKVLDIFTQLYQLNLILTPWYLNLTMLLMVGISSLILINGSINFAGNQQNYFRTINFLTILRCPIYKQAGPAHRNSRESKDEQTFVTVNNTLYEVVYQDKFKMCREILWALKMLNRMIILKNNQINTGLVGYIDHGSNEANMAKFSQFGFGAAAKETIHHSANNNASSNSSATNVLNESNFKNTGSGDGGISTDAFPLNRLVQLPLTAPYSGSSVPLVSQQRSNFSMPAPSPSMKPANHVSDKPKGFSELSPLNIPDSIPAASPAIPPQQSQTKQQKEESGGQQQVSPAAQQLLFPDTPNSSTAFAKMLPSSNVRSTPGVFDLNNAGPANIAGASTNTNSMLYDYILSQGTNPMLQSGSSNASNSDNVLDNAFAHVVNKEDNNNIEDLLGNLQWFDQWD